MDLQELESELGCADTGKRAMLLSDLLKALKLETNDERKTQMKTLHTLWGEDNPIEIESVERTRGDVDIVESTEGKIKINHSHEKPKVVMYDSKWDHDNVSDIKIDNETLKKMGILPFDSVEKYLLDPEEKRKRAIFAIEGLIDKLPSLISKDELNLKNKTIPLIDTKLLSTRDPGVMKEFDQFIKLFMNFVFAAQIHDEIRDSIVSLDKLGHWGVVYSETFRIKKDLVDFAGKYEELLLLTTCVSTASGLSAKDVFLTNRKLVSE